MIEFFYVFVWSGFIINQHVKKNMICEFICLGCVINLNLIKKIKSKVIKV